MGTVKWGILGAAKIAREQVIPAMKKSKNTELYAIASREISKAEDFCHKFSITKAYDDYNKLISDPNIDAVFARSSWIQFQFKVLDAFMLWVMG